MSYRALTPRETDTLKELCNIGAGHGATALSQMVGKPIMLTVPSVSVLPFKDVARAAGGAEKPVIGLFMRIYGDTKGHILLLLSQKSAAAFMQLLTGQAPPQAFYGEFHLDPMPQSMLKELGNIVASSFLSTLGQTLNVHMVPGVPGFAYDMAGAVLDTLLIELGEAGDTALMVETEFREPAGALEGHFFLIPDPRSLEVIMNAVSGMGGAP
jgi:chemotaxis protein CheC